MLVTLTDNYDRHKLSDEDSWQPDEISFTPFSTDFSHIKMMAVYYWMAVCSEIVNYTAGGTGKDKFFPRNQVAVAGR